MKTFGQMIKGLREKQDIPLRKVAAYIDIDQAILSKIEHGVRRPKREQVIELAKYFKVDEKPLIIKWLACKILDELGDDEYAVDGLQLSIQMLKSANNQLTEDKSNVLDYLKLGESTGMEKMFHSDKLPTYTELARYLFKAATGKKFDEERVNTQTNFIGEDKEYELYLFYIPNQEWLKNNALTLNMIKNLPDYKGKKRLIFASLKYVDDETCVKHHIEFAKIPY